MATSGDPETRKLREEQRDRASSECEAEREADEPAERRQHERRADKASYLEEKLAERDRSEGGAGEG